MYWYLSPWSEDGGPQNEGAGFVLCVLSFFFVFCVIYQEREIKYILTGIS